MADEDTTQIASEQVSSLIDELCAPEVMGLGEYIDFLLNVRDDINIKLYAAREDAKRLEEEVS